MCMLNVHSVSSPYFNKIKLTSHLGKKPALLLEIISVKIVFFQQRWNSKFQY